MRSWASALFMDAEVVWNFSVLVYHPKRISDWGSGREAERKDFDGLGRGILLSLGEYVFYFWYNVFLLFSKYTKFVTNWYVTWPSMETFETNFEMLWQFYLFLWNTKVDFCPSDRKSNWNIFLGGNQVFYQLQNAIKPSIFSTWS